jgi:hypothetical protein
MPSSDIPPAEGNAECPLSGGKADGEWSVVIIRPLGLTNDDDKTIKEGSVYNVGFVHQRVAADASDMKETIARGPFLFQTFLNLGNAFLKLALLGTCPSAQNQSHGFPVAPEAR